MQIGVTKSQVSLARKMCFDENFVLHETMEGFKASAKRKAIFWLFICAHSSSQIPKPFGGGKKALWAKLESSNAEAKNRLGMYPILAP